MSSGSLTSLEHLTARLLFSKAVCPTCALSTPTRHRSRQLSGSNFTPKPTTTRAQRRFASSLASSTAVNAQRDIPPRFRDLYGALEGLKKDAASYVNISRLGLALRSLESRRPTIRVALLGLRNTASARKLARLLLADVLSQEEEWEKRLQELDDSDSRGLLIRYGHETSLHSSSLLTTLHVPSRLLSQHNIEILISSLNISAGIPNSPIDTAELRRTALVPTAETPKSFKGDVSFITYPVHRAIVLAEGIQGCLALGRYATLNLDHDKPGSALQLAVNLPRGTADGQEPDDVPGIAVLDIGSGAAGISMFRASNANGHFYEQQWHKSGIHRLASWLAEGFPEGHDQTLNPAVTSLVSDLVNEASRHISSEDEARMKEVSRTTSVDEARQPLSQSLQQWAMRAHSELRNELDAAFASQKWAGLQWWKLLWRVDDVSMTVSELLERHWLVDAGRGIIWLSGRSVEAGFDIFTTKLAPERFELDQGSVAEEAKLQPNPSQMSIAKDIIVPPEQPWSSLIASARFALKQSTVPTLQATAQALLLQTLTITGATAGLAGLIYLALPTASLYSTGAVAALGLVWSLRHLQRRWEYVRASFESEVRESGRLTLKEMEEAFRAMLLLPRVVEGDVLVADRRRAKRAIEEVETCLQKVMKDGPR